MSLLNPTFVLGVILVLYLISFVAFAIIRIATGISIQRIGYLSLRHIAYTPRDGIRIDLRGLGLHLHRPTFAQPTWVSLRLTELKVTVDVKSLDEGGGGGRTHPMGSQNRHTNASKYKENGSPTSPRPIFRRSSSGPHRSRTWKRLTQLKERIKRLHEKINWLRMVDVVAVDSHLVLTDICHVQVGSLNIAVDTRRKTVDRSRLFQHKKSLPGDRRPAEWKFHMKSVLFTPEGKESLEVIDICGLNIHGLLYKDLAGLRDASIYLKLGRVHIPYDDLLTCQKRIENYRNAQDGSEAQEADISLTDVMEELDMPGSREANIVQTVSDSKEFVSSILRGVQEIQFTITSVGMSKEVRSVGPPGSPMYLNIAMNEFGIDMHRLDPKSPAHRMYFSPKDIAHQALLAAISIAVSVDDGKGKPDRLLYIPMATTTIKTTLPSKTLAISEDKNAAERNANILFANHVLTSPSLDLDPKHLPLILTLLRGRPESSFRPQVRQTHRHHLISRLLPKANIKFSVHEPVVRVTLPAMDPALKGTDEYDLLISSISSIAIDVESSHSSAGELHYALDSNLRISSHHLYYQNASGERHNLLLNEALELKVQLNASPEVCVALTGNIQTFSLHMVRPEISAGLQQIVQHMRNDSKDAHIEKRKSTKDPDFLRPLPPWLTQLQFQGSDFMVEVAGVDQEVSEDTRGIALRLESWTAEYKIQRSATVERRSSKHQAIAKPGAIDEPIIKVIAPPPSPKEGSDSTDGRRLAIHIRGFEGFVMDGIDIWEPESFISLPRFEIAFSTSSDSRGPIFHLNSHIKALYLHVSLYRYYAFGVATMVIKKALVSTDRVNNTPSSKPEIDDHLAFNDPRNANTQDRPGSPELFTIDIKAALLQVKATLPADPPMMLHVHSLEAGRHRWAVPFAKASFIRLYARAPQVKSAWTRLVSIKECRVDLRESRRKHGKAFTDEHSIDVSTEFVKIAIPHQLVLHKIVDNLANVAKATEQLHHRFRTGTNEYILNKGPEGPKKVPRVSIRSKAIQFELEDSPFDWKLGTIYRVGLIEQKQRRAREEAFSVKMRKFHECQQRRGTSRYRTQSSHPNERGRRKRSPLTDTGERSASAEPRPRRRSSPRSNGRGRRMRYDPDGVCGLTGSAKICTEDAWHRLQEYNAQSWKKRIDSVILHQKHAMREIRGMFWGTSEFPSEEGVTETIIALPDRPGLMSAVICDVHVVIDKPSFPIKDYPLFLHRVGKGMPYDMKYSLLVPLSLQIDMGEARITLRDYPLPLIHVPAIRPGQSPRLPSWSLKTDFVIGEEFQGYESIKHVKVEVVPARKFSDSKIKRGFAIDVRRTVSPVKTYSDIHIVVNTSGPTSITWGTSYQPAIQDIMMIIEGFTKPQVDLSDRAGFWDKIRLSAHGRVNVAWKGDGDVHLKLKGARDPYVVTGHGAGFVMCWRNNVRWGIHEDDDPKEFMTVNSGEYVLAIPDYSHQAREASAESGQDGQSISSTSSHKNSAIFKKVIMKLSGNVRWLAGLVFERDDDRGGRSFDFIPHYKVTLKNPDHARASNGQDYDAFRGFRSHHIHMSIAVVAPLDRDWSVTNLRPSASYNTVHLSPRFFTHFLNWWSMFSGAMSLPIRQGKLFPGVEKSSKKFGRHLATIKYNLLFSPLFIAHIYKHKDAEDYSEDVVSATGLKLRIDSFMLDLHQRREEFATQGKGRLKQPKTSGMRINKAQLDFISADMRAVSASIAGTTAEDLKRATDEDLVSYQQPSTSVDMSRFTIPDNDFSWIDMDDFVELDWILPAESNPETKIMPLAFAPRFTYFRETDHQGMTSKDSSRTSPFGNELTHFCIMSQDNDPRKVQCELVKERLVKVEEQIETHRRVLGEQELRVTRDGNRDGSLKDHFEILSHQSRVLDSKKRFLQSTLRRYTRLIEKENPTAAQNGDTSSSSDTTSDAGPEDIESAHFADFVNDFNNRFIIHNVQLKWNNSLRNIILRYVHQVSQRRGFVYYMSRKAVKFILDIVDEQSKIKQKKSDNQEQSTPSPAPSAAVAPESPIIDGTSVEDRIQELLNDGKKFVNADATDLPDSQPKPSADSLSKDISEEFTPKNSYYVRLIAPQIQLQSEKNSKSVLLVTAKGMQLKVIQIMDKDRITDDVSGLVQRRFSLDMDSVQFFVTNQKTFTQFLHLYSANRYGSPKGSAWPPWVPPEINFDFELDPLGFSRVVRRTSASLRYDKYNNLRLKYNDEITGGTPSPETMESRIDQLWVEFPHIRAICDSAQYYTIYVIVLDLLLYNEPLEKVRSERLEKIMLASDFSDLRGSPETIVSLQQRIRQLEEIKTHFQVHAKYLDRQGWQDRLSIERDLTSCEDELFFMMKAITTSQRKNDDRTQTSQSNGVLRWRLSASEIVWHLMRKSNEPLMEIQLRNAAYDRTDNSDGSNHNSMGIERIHGLNLLPNALYPEMLAPYFEDSKAAVESQDIKMLKVHWYMLEAIAGIPVLDQFEVNLFPLRVGLEREVGKKLFEYIFPGAGQNGGENGGSSPFMLKPIHTMEAEDEDSDLDDQNSVIDVSQTYGLGLSDAQPAETRAGSLELRLRPTLHLPEGNPRQNLAASSKAKNSITGSNGEVHRFKFFQHSNRSQPASKLPSGKIMSKKASKDSLRGSARASTTSLSVMNGSSDKPKKFALHRTSSRDNTVEKDKASDDLTQMISRASNYMTLAYVRIPSVVLCLSYKGRGERNIEDVHNFVFRMPVLEYRNKTWSNLDLALRLKKDVIKALISHTGAIIGNKLSHHRPGKYQTSRLREQATSSTILPSANSLRNSTITDTSSATDQSPIEDLKSPLRRSVSFDPSHQITRSESFASSVRSSVLGNGMYNSEPPSIPESEAEGDDTTQPIKHNAFTRRFTSDGQKPQRKETPSNDAEESPRKKSVLLLGRKFLGSLN